MQVSPLPSPTRAYPSCSRSTVWDTVVVSFNLSPSIVPALTTTFSQFPLLWVLCKVAHLIRASKKRDIRFRAVVVPLRFLSPRRHPYPIRTLSSIQGLPLPVWSSLVLVLASRSVSAAVEPSLTVPKISFPSTSFPQSCRKRVHPLPSCSNNYRCENQPVPLLNFILSLLPFPCVILSFAPYNYTPYPLILPPFPCLDSISSITTTRTRRMKPESC